MDLKVFPSSCRIDIVNVRDMKVRETVCFILILTVKLVSSTMIIFGLISFQQTLSNAFS